jgi:hypothetical protein
VPLSVVGVLLALTGALLVTSAAAFPVRTRPDMLIYGRYTEVIAPPLIAIGIVVLGRTRLPQGLARPALGFALLTGVVVLIRATAGDPDAANRWNISALPFVTVQLGPAILVGAAVVSAAGAWLLIRSAKIGSVALGGVAVALFLAVAAYGAWNPVRSSQHAVYPDGWSSPQPVAEDNAIRQLAYDLDHYDTIGLYVPQWFLPQTSISLVKGGENARSRYLLTARAAPPRASGPTTRLWIDSGRDQAIWRVRDPQDAR